jgi:hypothetical protein
MRRVATLEIRIVASPVADATAVMLRGTDPWDKSYGYHHASAPRVAKCNRIAMTDGNREIHSTDRIYPTDENGEGKWNRIAMI